MGSVGSPEDEEDTIALSSDSEEEEESSDEQPMEMAQNSSDLTPLGVTVRQERSPASQCFQVSTGGRDLPPPPPRSSSNPHQSSNGLSLNMTGTGHVVGVAVRPSHQGSEEVQLEIFVPVKEEKIGDTQLGRGTAEASILVSTAESVGSVYTLPV